MVLPYMKRKYVNQVAHDDELKLVPQGNKPNLNI